MMSKDYNPEYIYKRLQPGIYIYIYIKDYNLEYIYMYICIYKRLQPGIYMCVYIKDYNLEYIYICVCIYKYIGRRFQLEEEVTIGRVVSYYYYN